MAGIRLLHQIARPSEAGPVSWISFLEKSPPGKVCSVKDVIEIDGPFFNIATPDIRFYCGHQACSGEKSFTYNGLKLAVNIGKSDDYFLNYICSHCKASQMNMKVHLQISSLFGTNKAMKY